MLSTIAEIIRDLLIFVGVIAALFIALIHSRLAAAQRQSAKAGTDRHVLSPRRHISGGSCRYPVRAYAGIDLLYDIGVPIVLIWYWYTFFRDARRTTSDTSPTGQKRVTYGGI